MGNNVIAGWRSCRVAKFSPYATSPPRYLPLNWVAFLLLSCMLLLSCSNRSQTLDRIQADGVMRVGLDPTFPPFENGDGGLHGIDVDLARAIGREMGVEIEFVLFGYDGLYDALLIDRCDILISALIIDDTKTKEFAYSDPYFNAGQFIVTHESNRSINRLTDLEGQKVAVETGSAGHVEAISAQNRVRNLTILTYPTPDDAMWPVLQQELPAALIDQVNARLYIQTHPSLSLVEEPLTVEPYAVVTRKDDDSLLNEINLVLENLQSTGEIDQIIGQWIGSP